VATASAIALLAHAISFVPVTILGVLFLLTAPAKAAATEER
jgi:hypothetical protein